MAFPTSFAQNPEFDWAPPVQRRRTLEPFSIFIVALSTLLLAIASVAPAPLATGGEPFQLLGP